MTIVSAQEIPFSTPTEDREYCIFSDEYEKNSNIVFHGTSMQFFESIMKTGFCSAKALKLSDVASVSFAKNSSVALAHACEKWSSDDRVIFAASLENIESTTICDEGSVVYIFDPNTKPAIIAYCFVPQDYQLRVSSAGN